MNSEEALEENSLGEQTTSVTYPVGVNTPELWIGCTLAKFRRNFHVTVYQ
jgi:hypothetical protein